MTTWNPRLDVVEALEAAGWTGDTDNPLGLLRHNGAVWGTTSDAGDSSLTEPTAGQTIGFPSNTPDELIVATCLAAAGQADHPLADEHVANLEALAASLPPAPWSYDPDSEVLHDANGQMIADLWHNQLGEYLVAMHAATLPLFGTVGRLRLALKSAQRRAARRQPHEREGLIFHLERENKRVHSFARLANDASQACSRMWEESAAEAATLREANAVLLKRIADAETRLEALSASSEPPCAHESWEVTSEHRADGAGWLKFRRCADCDDQLTPVVEPEPHWPDSAHRGKAAKTTPCREMNHDSIGREVFCEIEDPDHDEDHDAGDGVTWPRED
jgi:hypothetical protein